MDMSDLDEQSVGLRLEWHRKLMGMTQTDYAASIGVKRPTYTVWERGLQRLTLNGAIAIRERYGLPLDWLFFGDDSALPMTIRSEWLSRPRVKS